MHSPLISRRCRRLGPLLPLLAALLLLACGGGGDAPPAAPAPTQPPTSAQTSATLPASTTAPAPTSTATPAGAAIAIDGSPEFVDWTQQALQLIETRAPEWYARVTASIQAIRSVEAGSGMDVVNKLYQVGEQTAYAPGFQPAQQLVWYAGTIVHDACHSRRYDQGQVYQGKEGELACLADQKAALQLLNDDPYFADYVQGLIDGADDPANQYWTNPNRHW